VRTLNWERDGADWPNRAASRFVQAGGMTWHVQVMGEGPVILLAHGTGASTHSWRAFAPLLARHFTVVAPDLPGHGFTRLSDPDRLALPGMAASLAALVRSLDKMPSMVAGHSAGAAVLAQMCLMGAVAPAGLVSLNGALLPMRGMAGQLFAPMARMLATTSIVPRLFAWRASDPRAVERLIRGTGSRLDPEGIRFYRRLVESPAHVAAALGMMARWDLDLLERELPRLRAALLLILGSEDRAVPASEAARIRDKVPDAQVRIMRGLGHLAHEEKPAETAEFVLAFARSLGVLPE